MRIEKQQKDNQYIKDEPMEQLRDFAQCWLDRAGGQSLRNYIAILDDYIYKNYVKLPVDSEGQLWEGSEPRMICNPDIWPNEEKPNDDNPAFMDGLLYDGNNWKVLSYSADGTAIGCYPANECRHVHKFDPKETLLDFSKQIMQLKTNDEREKFIDNFVNKYTLIQS